MTSFCSIGSLGKGKSEAIVSDVSVTRAKLSGTTNGVRIKTWQVKDCFQLPHLGIFPLLIYIYKLLSMKYTINYSSFMISNSIIFLGKKWKMKSGRGRRSLWKEDTRSLIEQQMDERAPLVFDLKCKGLINTIKSKL